MKRQNGKTFLATAFVAMFAATAGAEQTAYVNGARVDGAEPGEWTHDWDAATAAAKKDGKPVFVNFTGSDWCGWCKLLKRQVFSQPEWGAWASNHVYLVHVDFPNDKELVPEKYRDRNREISRKYKVGGYPTCHLLHPATLESLGTFGASRDVTAEGFIVKVSAAMPVAEKAEPSGPNRPERPAPAPRAGGPVFDIQDGVLRGVKSEDAEEIVVPEGVKTVCIDGLVHGRMKTLTIPEGVETLSRRSGGYVPGAPFETVRIPASVRSIERGAFDGNWRRLRTIEIAAGSPFAMRDGCLVDTRDDSLVFALPGRGRIVLPRSVKTVGDWSVAANDAREIVVPEGVSKIGRGAFKDCRSLEILSLSASVEEIAKDAFSNCGKLARIDVSPDNPRYAARDGFLLDRRTGTLLRAFGPLVRVTVPGDVRTIGDHSFSFLDTLVSVTVPDSVRRIEDGAFAYCKNLEELRLPERLDFCDDHFIMGCSSLREIRLPAGLTSIWGNFSFGGCSRLRELVFPEGLQTIGCNGLGAVLRCDELERIFIPASVSAISGGAFKENPKLATIDVHPDNPSFRSEDGVLFSKDMTRLVRCPETKKGVYEIPGTVRKIDSSAFFQCRDLMEIRIPEGVTDIGWHAFAECPAKTNRVETSTRASAGLPINKFPISGIVAGFTFNDEDKANDFMKKGRKFALQHVPSGRPLDLDSLVTNGALRLNGVYSGENANITHLDVPELRYDRFTVAMNFRPQAERGRSVPLVSFGGGWRWFHVLLRSDGTPVVSFRGLEKGEVSYPLPEKFIPDEWNWIAVAFDIAGRRLSVVLNGQRLPDIALPADFAFRLDRNDRERSRSVQFANTNNGTVFKGEISGFLLFDRAFTDEEMDAIATAPVALAVPWTFVPDEEGAALYWNGTISNGSVTLDARLADGGAAVSFPESLSVPGGILDLVAPIVDGNGAEVPLVGIGSDVDDGHVGFGGVRRTVSEVRLPATVRHLGPGAFERFVSLARFDCPASVRRIGSAAFDGCANLRRFRVGPAVEFFSSDRVFMGCDALEAIEVDPQNRFFKTVDGALLTADGKRLVAFPPGRKGPFAIPAGVEAVPARAFLGCRGLTRVSVPASVKKIGDFAFANCPALERIEFEDRSFKLDDRAFGSSRDGKEINRPATNLGGE